MTGYRHLICLLAALAGAPHAIAKDLYVGQVAPLSGPAASIGIPVTQAAHAYFRKINEAGGIQGNRVVLIDRDDGFKPERTLQEIDLLLKEKPVIALINVVGAPNNGDLVATGLLAKHGLAVVGAFTGATSVRALKSPHLYFVRASVEDEARKMAAQAGALGITRIGLVHANDAFGLDARKHVEKSLGELSLQLVGHAAYEPATAEVSAAVSTLRNSGAQAIIVFGTGPATARFAVEYRKAGGGGLILANSSTAPEVLVKIAGAQYARGVGLVQVMPPLIKTTIPVVREYLETLRAYADAGATPSPYGLEGFLAAKVLAEGLRKAGPAPTRELLLKGLNQIGVFDAGGVLLNYSAGSREGLKAVEIGIMSASGKLTN